MTIINDNSKEITIRKSSHTYTTHMITIKTRKMTLKIRQMFKPFIKRKIDLNFLRKKKLINTHKDNYLSLFQYVNQMYRIIDDLNLFKTIKE